MNNNPKPEAQTCDAQPGFAPLTGSVVELAKRIPFRMVMHMNCGKEHHLDYLNEELNLACCITTPYRNGKPGKGKREYGINEKGATGYKTLAELLKANPQVTWKAALLYLPNDQAQRPLADSDAGRKGKHGTNCGCTDGVSHSKECRDEYEVATAMHYDEQWLHEPDDGRGWKCHVCNYGGSANNSANVFCANCHRHK